MDSRAKTKAGEQQGLGECSVPRVRPLAEVEKTAIQEVEWAWEDTECDFLLKGLAQEQIDAVVGYLHKNNMDVQDSNNWTRAVIAVLTGKNK